MTKKTKTWIWVSLIVVALIVGASLFFFIKEDSNNTNICDELPTTIRIDADIPTNFSISINNSYLYGGKLEESEKINNVKTPFSLSDRQVSDFKTDLVVMISFGQNTEINIECKNGVIETFKLGCVENIYYKLKC